MVFKTSPIGDCSMMEESIKYLELGELNEQQLREYRDTIKSSYPDFIFHSQILKDYWPKLEAHFSALQLFMVDSKGFLIGFINAITFFWDKPLNELSAEGWDWLIQRGLKDQEEGIKPNCLGGLQIIVTRNNLGKGYSNRLISLGKEVKEKLGLKHFIIPIRPIFKYHFPEMKMEEYIALKNGDKIYDPWIRTHLNNGAEIINVCENSMNIKADILFWEEVIDRKINTSGLFVVQGALSPVLIDVAGDIGEYREANIWIHYP